MGGLSKLLRELRSERIWNVLFVSGHITIGGVLIFKPE